jgi:uncharacterized membrane protein
VLLYYLRISKGVLPVNREEFSEELKKKIAGLPPEEIEGRVSFYNEIIDDHMEEGMSEEDAVAALGSVDSIAEKIMAELPITQLIGGQVNPGRKNSAGRTVFLICMFPVWIILFALVIALYAVIWALVIALYCVVIAFATVALTGIPGSVYMLVQGRKSEAALVLAIAIFMAGLTVVLVIASIAATKGAARLTKRVGIGYKSIFVRKKPQNDVVEGGAQA